LKRAEKGKKKYICTRKKQNDLGQQKCQMTRNKITFLFIVQLLFFSWVHRCNLKLFMNVANYRVDVQLLYCVV